MDKPAHPSQRARSATRSQEGSQRRTRTRLDTESRRAQLVELGTRVFAEKSYDEASVDEIAALAGISKGLLYHYFPTKRDLYLACLQAVAEELLARADLSDAPLPPLERLRAGIDAYLAFAAEHARAYLALMRGGVGSDREIVAYCESVRDRFVSRILTAPTSPLASVELPPLFRVVLRGWVGFAEAAAIDWLARGAPDRAAVRDAIVQMAIHAFQVGGAAKLFTR
ncbi:MAG: TetR/AcrR family transcriptional regulator [Deltaproteobacteria bacterium]|nr:TetR/AcrR family transcriptional regulator [Deltaproteobacteria bacterium]